MIKHYFQKTLSIDGYSPISFSDIEPDMVHCLDIDIYPVESTMVHDGWVVTHVYYYKNVFGNVTIGTCDVGFTMDMREIEYVNF